MSRWKRKLASFDSLAEEIAEKQKRGEGNLRFNRSFIPASDIAQQYFCEKKVEMNYLHGDVETEEKSIGTEGHEKLLEGSMEIKRQELWKKIHEKEPTFALEMHLLAKYKDVALAGRLDSVIFQNGYPMILFEYKFSKSRIAYKTHHVQAKTYGILLRNMGFDTSRLFYAIVIADPEARYDKALRKKVVQAVDMNGPKEAELNIQNTVIYLQKFNEEEAERDIDWAIEFWKNTREAIITSNPNKCKNCEHKVECSKSLHKQLSNYQLSKRREK
jgi:hypothetical protein